MTSLARFRGIHFPVVMFMAYSESECTASPYRSASPTGTPIHGSAQHDVHRCQLSCVVCVLLRSYVLVVCEGVCRSEIGMSGQRAPVPGP